MSRAARSSNRSCGSVGARSRKTSELGTAANSTADSARLAGQLAARPDEEFNQYMEMGDWTKVDEIFTSWYRPFEVANFATGVVGHLGASDCLKVRVTESCVKAVRMPDTDKLRIYGHAERPVHEVREFLRSLEESYNGIYAFDMILESEIERAQKFPHVFTWGWAFPSFPRLMPHEWRTLVRPDAYLILRAASLSSPGFWDFIAKLNPLEVIRHYLIDRHERRKDQKYREIAEEHRLELENHLLANKVLRERIEIAKSLGATEADLIPLLNQFVHHPLRELSRHQDSGLIEGAEIVRLEIPDKTESID